jgi:hypothetical protein
LRLHSQIFFSTILQNISDQNKKQQPNEMTRFKYFFNLY